MARILVIRQFYYPQDPRVRREVEALESDGHEIDILCLAKPGQPVREQNGRVTIRRLPVRHRRGGAVGYLLEYGLFLMAAFFSAGWMHLRRRYQLVQVNSLPDALVFAALVPKLLGARVLLDLHECMPEFFATKFKTSMSHPGVRVVAWAEQASIRFADRAITCTEQMREAFVARGACSAKIGIVLNAADETLFNPARHPHTGSGGDGFTVVMHGAVEERYGLDTVIRAVALLKDELPLLRFDVYGEGGFLDELRRLARALGVAEQVVFHGYVPMEELLDGIARADAGVVAMKRDAFRDLTHCNKMYDFIAMKVPVITSRTRSVEAYFPDGAFAYFTSDDPLDLAGSLRRLAADPELRGELVREATRVNEPYRWPYQRRHYLQIVRGLVQRGAGRQRAGAAERAMR